MNTIFKNMNIYFLMFLIPCCTFLSLHISIKKKIATTTSEISGKHGKKNKRMKIV